MNRNFYSLLLKRTGQNFAFFNARFFLDMIEIAMLRSDLILIWFRKKLLS